MKNIEQGGQHVLILSKAEYDALRLLAGNGTADSAAENGMGQGGERKIWERIAQWAYSGKVPD